MESQKTFCDRLRLLVAAALPLMTKKILHRPVRFCDLKSIYYVFTADLSEKYHQLYRRYHCKTNPVYDYLLILVLSRSKKVVFITYKAIRDLFMYTSLIR